MIKKLTDKEWKAYLKKHQPDFKEGALQVHGSDAGI